MKNIIYLITFLGCINMLIAKEPPSQVCLSLENNQIEPCLDEAHTTWDKKLNDAYKSVMGYLSKEKKVELRNQQRTWIKARDKKCAALDSDNKKACLLDETQVKALKLEVLAKPFEGLWAKHYDSIFEVKNDEIPWHSYSYYRQKGDLICGISTSINLNTMKSTSNLMKYRQAKRNEAEFIASCDNSKYINESKNNCFQQHDNIVNKGKTWLICNDHDASGYSECKEFAEYLKTISSKADSDELMMLQFNPIDIPEDIKTTIYNNNPWLKTCLEEF